MNKLRLNRRNFILNLCLAGAAISVNASLPKIVFAGNNHTQMVQQTKLMMGTIVTIKIASANKSQANEAILKAFESANYPISVLSRHDSSSPLSILNLQGKITDVPSELLYVLNESLKLAKKTEFTFNPAVLPFITYLEQNKTNKRHLKIPSSDLKELANLSDFSSITFNQNKIKLGKAGMGLTLDGIAKGYVVDVMSASLTKSGIDNFLIDAGGDIFAKGCPNKESSWKIGIDNGSGVIKEFANISNQAIATSGRSESFYDSSKSSNHLINPYTGRSSTFLSVSAVSLSAMQADALATAASLLSPNVANSIALSENSDLLISLENGSFLKSKYWKRG